MATISIERAEQIMRESKELSAKYDWEDDTQLAAMRAEQSYTAAEYDEANEIRLAKMQAEIDATADRDEDGFRIVW